MKPIPVILDTDIGSDIDDSWALAMLLGSPELDLKMVLTDTGDTTYRAKLAAKMLQIADRQEVEIGIGIPFEDKQRFMADWVKTFDLDSYGGKVHLNGVAAFVAMVMASKEKITLIGISAVPNLAAALKLEPRIANKIRLVGMFGSVYKGYENKSTPEPEANVRYHNAACRKVFAAFKDITITPIDTCGLVRFEGEQYQRLLKASNPVMQAVMQQYHLWSEHVTWARGINTQKISSILFDTVAVYLAYSEDYLEIKNLGLRISEKGMTELDSSAKPLRAALRWKDLDAFKEHLLRRLTGCIGNIPRMG